MVMEQRLYAVAESPALSSRANANAGDNPETVTSRSTTFDTSLGLPNDIFSTQNLTFQFPRFMQTPTFDHRLLEWATPIYPPVAAAAPPSSMTIFTSPPTSSTMGYPIHYPPHPHPHIHPHPHPGPSYPHSSSTTTAVDGFHYGTASAVASTRRTSTTSVPFEFPAYTAAPTTVAASGSLGSHTLQIQAQHESNSNPPTSHFHFTADRTPHLQPHHPPPHPQSQAPQSQSQSQSQDQGITTPTATSTSTAPQTPGPSTPTENLEIIPRPIFTTLGPLLPNGLPIYSATGFDMLDILGRVATRPNPKVSLGPVDMTASFVVVDTTKPDHPIVHVSPGFTHLTGYTESEILGRNCRFLQAPPDKSVEKGTPRQFTDQDAVAKLSQYLSQNNECQVSLVNYHKSGKPFINCLTVIPLCLGPSSEARYHVGFQVDLATQPRVIMDSVKNGTYIVNYNATHAPTGSSLLSRLITQDMMGVLGSIYPDKAGKQFDETRDREDLSKALVQFATDPILVLSLKGHFLYVSPSVSRLFGYNEDWFMGKNLTDLCHPSDHVATMRALKEASPTSGRPTLNNDNEPLDERPGTVHLLFRARINTNSNSGGDSSTGGKEEDKDAQEYIWVECPSRLHTDGARGRKAVIVHVRRREVPRVSWSSINASDGIARDDVWIRIACDERALVLDASENALHVLGRTPDELVGASLIDFLIDDARSARKDALRSAIARAHSASAGDEVAKTAWCNMPVADRRARRDVANEEDVAAEEKHTTEEGTRTGSAPVPGPKLAVATFEIAIFPPRSSASPIAGESGAWRSTPHSMVCRLRIKSKREAADANHTSHGSKVHPPQQQAYSGGGSGSGTVNPSTFTPVHPFSYSYLSSVGPSTSTSSSTAKLSGSLMSVRAPNSNAVKVLRTGNATDVMDSTASSTAEPTPTTATLCAGMDSSWQYELSLLRNRNEKLRADVGIMEKERKARRRHRRKMGSLSVGAPAGARLINGVGVGGVSVSSGLGLGLNQRQWLVQQQQQQQAHLHEEASKARNLAGDVHMTLPGEGHHSNLKRTREMAGFEIGAPSPPTWNPGGRPWGV